MNYLEDNIKHLYSTLNIETPEELTMEYIALKLNILLFYWDEPSQALFNHGRAYIFLKRSLSPQIQWEEFCHELAHVILHVGDQMHLPKSFIEYQEMKANNFALHAAIPTFMLLELNLPNNYYQAITLLQKTFNVSLAFACKRLNHFLANNPAYISQMTKSIA